MANLTSLADPTNFGNRPGDGPLRPGGQEAGLPATEKDLPSRFSKAAARQHKALALVRDCWCGTERMHECTTEYLPKAPGEDTENYNMRLTRSVFHNFYRRTVEGLVGLIFRKDPMLGDDVPPVIAGTEDGTGEAGHWENIDNAGTHGDVFLRELTQDAMVAGHAAIFVEYPATGGAQRARDEMSGAVRPYWLPIRKEDIVSWRTTVEDGRVVLTQIVLREVSMVPDGRFGEREQTRYRVLYRGTNPMDTTDGSQQGASEVGFVLLEVRDNKEVALVDKGTYPTQEEIPIAEVTTSGRRGMFESDPPLLDVAYLNVAHYQQWSDYVYSAYKTCVPIFVTLGLGKPRNNLGEPVELVLGPNSGLDIPDPNGDAKYVSHSGESLKEVRESLEALKNDIGTLGLAMLAPQKRTAETAEAKRLDKSTSDAPLSVTARGIQDAVERALGFHARYLGLDDGGSIKINRDFEGLLMDPDVMRAYAVLTKDVGLPGRVVLKALKEGGRLPEDEDLDTLELEMMANAEAERERQREEAEMRAESLGVTQEAA